MEYSESRKFSPIAAKRTFRGDDKLVWETISASGGLVNYHPFCAENPVEHWPGPNSSDRIVYLSGMTFERTFFEWHEGSGYALRLSLGERAVAEVRWSVLNGLAIEVTPLLPVDMSDQEAQTHLGRYFGDGLVTYLHCILKGVEHWLETGEPVRPNQFGCVRGYSAQS